MDKEILEITKEFHDTYEKLASEYTYETREDTKVFDINSNNGKLMYATVNEVIKPILEENKKQKKVLDKANKKLNNFIECCKAEKLESGNDYIHHQYWDMFERFNKQVKDILKEVSE